MERKCSCGSKKRKNEERSTKRLLQFTTLAIYGIGFGQVTAKQGDVKQTVNRKASDAVDAGAAWDAKVAEYNEGGVQ